MIGTPAILDLPDLLSVVRVPLGAAFVPLAGRHTAALVLLTLAGISDVLDGWLARRMSQRKTHGNWLDPVCDKLFISAVVVGLLLHATIPWHVLLLLLTRELALLVLYVIYRSLPALRRVRYDYQAHLVGKITTLAQFLAVLAILLHSEVVGPLAWACGVLGLACAWVYGRRAHLLVRKDRSPASQR